MTVSCFFELRRPNHDFKVGFRFDEQIMGVFGPSGAGKTTLLHLLAGIQEPDRGHCVVRDQTLFDSEQGINVPCYQRRIAVVFQQGLLFPHKNVAANLRYGEAMVPPAERLFSFDRIIQLLELEPFLEKTPRQLSGGEVQRVALGRALLYSPRLLLLDEPMASLDRGIKRHILPFLRLIQSETAIPMVYVSHDLGEILQLTDHLLILNQGSVVGQGSFLELVQDVSALELLHDLRILNVVKMNVQSHRKEEWLTALVVPSEKRMATTQDLPWIAPYINIAEGDYVHALIRAEDIALIRKPVPDISIRNQIMGVISNIVVSSQRVLCVVDIGVKLLVEISPNAVNSMGLQKGQPICCLFKAQAVRYLD